MKTQNLNAPANHRRQIKTVPQAIARLSPPLVAAGASALALLFLLGCTAPKPMGIVRSAPTPLPEPLRRGLGTIALTSPQPLASFSFDKSDGRIDYASDSAGEAARQILQTPIDPAVALGATAAELAAAPIAAACSALGAEHKKLPPDKLTEVESDLTKAMSGVAEQKQFRDSVFKAAADKTRRHLVPFDSNASSGAEPINAVLET